MDLFSKKYVVMPVNEKYLPLRYDANTSAHWWVVIICNLDNAKPSKESPRTPKTRTRAKAEPSPEPVDVDGLETKDSATPVPSTPSATMDVVDVPSDVASERAVESDDILMVREDVALVHTPAADALSADIRQVDINGPSESLSAPEVPCAKAPSTQVIDVDEPSPMEIDREFCRMSISQDSESYSHRKDTTIDSPTRRAIDAALRNEKQYTRRTAAILRDDPIVLEDGEEPASITTALRQKYNPSGKPAPTLRRTSSKIVPLESCYPLSMKLTSSPVIIVFDSLGLSHVYAFKILREYLIDEAKTKRGMDLAKHEIAGLHAKVPKQGNYCDCGVFLLHYVERFLQDPDRYLPDILVRFPQDRV